jgi:hypothetical protein
VSIPVFEPAKRGSLLAARFFIRPVPVLLLASPCLVSLLASPLEAQEASHRPSLFSFQRSPSPPRQSPTAH